MNALKETPFDPVQMDALNMARAADREKAAQSIINLVERAGCSVERHPHLTRREIVLTIYGARGVSATVSLSADTWKPSNGFVVPWNIKSGDDARFALNFWNANPHHRRKATMICDRLSDLLWRLPPSMEKTFDGSAFDPAAEAAFIEKDGTDAENDARFAALFNSKK